MNWFQIISVFKILSFPISAAFEEDEKTMDVEATCEISIGSEICDQEQIDQVHIDGQGPFSVEMEEQSSEIHIEAADKGQGTC